MDFVIDQLLNGRHFRALLVVDNFSRTYLPIDVGQLFIEGSDVTCEMCRLRAQCAQIPERIQMDHDSEFISKVLINVHMINS